MMMSRPITGGSGGGGSGGGHRATKMRIELNAIHLVIFVATVFTLNVGVLAYFISSAAPPTGDTPTVAVAAEPREAMKKFAAGLQLPGMVRPQPGPTEPANTSHVQSAAGSSDARKAGSAEPSLFSPTWCTHLWKSQESVFCNHPGTTLWSERGANKPSEVLFTFTQLFFIKQFKEVGLHDASRGIVVVLLRTSALLADGAKDEAQARKLAREVDHVFQKGGWHSDTLISKIPPRTRTADPIHTATIIVMISAYRDVLCSNSLKELFTHAGNPERVRVGVILQADFTDMDCLEDYCKEVGEANCHRSQIRQLRRTLDHSRGVMPARYLQQTLIADEEFCLQIDSHMVFPPNWDAIAIEDWLSARNEMAVMTTYPNRAADRENQDFSPARCNTVWGHNVVAGGTSAHNIRHGKDPILVAFFGAGIAFNKCHANLAVPIDPYMSFMFKGEEFDRSSRLWTSGYDLYAPKKNYAYHFYDDDPKPPGHEKDKPRDRSFLSGSKDATELLLQSELRWMMIMGMLDEELAASVGPADKAERLKQAHAQGKQLREAMAQQIGLYGLGSRRSLRAYQIYSGVNLKKHTMVDICDKLGKMEWVPWDREADFEPIGKGCAAARDVQVCCRHTLAQGAKLVDEHLALTNAEWAQKVRTGAIVAPPQSGPIISRGWDDAQLVPDCSFA